MRRTRHLYRTPTVSVTAVVLGLAAVGFAIWTAASSRGQAVGGVVAILIAVLAWRLWGAGISVTANGVGVRGIFWSRRVAWTQVAHFEIARLGQYPIAVYLVCRDMRRFSTIAVAFGGRGSDEASGREDAEETVGALQGAAQQYAVNDAPHTNRLVPEE